MVDMKMREALSILAERSWQNLLEEQSEPSEPTFRFFVRMLPARALSPNGDRPNHFDVAAARAELRAETVHAIREAFGADIPSMGRARVSVVLHMTTKRPRDGRYRAKDAWNAAYALKPVPDAMVDLGITDDDDWEHQVIGSVSRKIVDSLEAEGIEILVEPL